MSLRPTPFGPVPEQTSRIARAAFPAGNPYLRMRDALEALVEDRALAHLFPTRGRPAETPWRLALVTIYDLLPGLRSALAEHICLAGCTAKRCLLHVWARP